MDQETRWLEKYNEVRAFIEKNQRNPSKHNPTERGLYFNWLRHNKKLHNSGKLKEERVEMFKDLLELSEKYKRVNQYL